MRTKRQEGMVWPIVAGTSLAARIRRLTFAIFGLAAAAGLALVAFVAQTGYPVLSVAPLPLPGPALTAPGTGVRIGEAEGGSFGLGFSLPGASGFVAGPDGLATGAPGVDGEPALFGVDSAGFTQSGSTQSDLATPTGKAGLDDAPQSEVTAVTPAQEPTVPTGPAVAAAPVQGSNTSTALFVRSTVAPGIGEDGDVGKGAPVVPGEPEIPYEPEVPVEPDVPVEPEAPVEPPVEPEVPVEPPVEEPPAEVPPAEEPPATEPLPAAETAPEVPAG